MVRMVAMPSGCGRMQVSAAGKVEDELHTNTGLEPVPDIYALGDCCANVETPLPALAQVCARPALSAQGAVRAARAGTELRSVLGHVDAAPGAATAAATCPSC